jgi:hypothetical protein
LYAASAYLDDLSRVEKMLGAPRACQSWSKTLPAKRSYKDRLTSAALSEGTALAWSTQGSASLHPGLQSSCAFGVLSDNLIIPPDRKAFDDAKHMLGGITVRL